MSGGLLKRISFNVTKDYSATDDRQVPASTNVHVYRAGASYLSGTGTAVIGVTGIGDIRIADTLRVGTDAFEATGTAYTVGSISTAQTIVLTGTGAFIAGDRLIPTNDRPVLYADETGTGTPLSNPLVTDADTGRVVCYVREHNIDYVVEGTGVTTAVFIDAAGGVSTDRLHVVEAGVVMDDNTAGDANTAAMDRVLALADLDDSSTSKIVIPTGELYIGSLVSTPQLFDIRGEAGSSLVADASYAESVMIGEPAGGSSGYNCQLVGPQTIDGASTSGLYGFVSLRSIDNLTIRGVTFTDLVGAVELLGAYDWVTIEGCRFVNTTDSAIKIDGVTNLIIRDCMFDNVASAGGHAIEMSGPLESVNISNIQMKTVGSGNASAACVSVTGTGTGAVIGDCERISINGLNAKTVQKGVVSSGAWYVNVSNTQLYGAANTAMEISACRHIGLSSVIATDGTVTDAPGILLDAVTYFTIGNSQVVNYDGAGLELSGATATSKGTVNGSLFRGNNVGAASNGNINILSADEVAIVGCSILDAPGYGVFSDSLGVSDILVDGCVIQGNGSGETSGTGITVGDTV